MKIKEKVCELFAEGFVAWIILVLLLCLFCSIYFLLVMVSSTIYGTPVRWPEILGFLIAGIAGFLFLTLLLGIISRFFSGLVSNLCNLVKKEKIKNKEEPQGSFLFLLPSIEAAFINHFIPFFLNDIIIFV